MSEKEIIEIETKAIIKLLESLPHIPAFTGNIGAGGYAQMKSYVEYGIILKILNEKREVLKNLNI
jgi:hypothetical protein